MHLAVPANPAFDANALVERMRFTLSADDLFGKCDSELELRLPFELKETVRRVAGERGMTMGAYVRLVLAKDAMGQEHVLSVITARLGMAPAPVPTTIPVAIGNGQ